MVETVEGYHVVRLSELLGQLEGKVILKKHVSTDDFMKSIEEEANCIPPQLLRDVIAEVFTCSSFSSLEGVMIRNCRSGARRLKKAHG